MKVKDKNLKKLLAGESVYVDRYSLSEKDLKAFVDHCYNVCEAAGFLKGFNDYFADSILYSNGRNGQSFKVIDRVNGSWYEDLVELPMWVIEFDDGKRIRAYPSEIINIGSSDVLSLLRMF